MGTGSHAHSGPGGPPVLLSEHRVPSSRHRAQRSRCCRRGLRGASVLQAAGSEMLLTELRHINIKLTVLPPGSAGRRGSASVPALATLGPRNAARLSPGARAPRNTGSPSPSPASPALGLPSMSVSVTTPGPQGAGAMGRLSSCDRLVLFSTTSILPAHPGCSGCRTALPSSGGVTVPCRADSLGGSRGESVSLPFGASRGACDPCPPGFRSAALPPVSLCHMRRTLWRTCPSPHTHLRSPDRWLNGDSAESLCPVRQGLRRFPAPLGAGILPPTGSSLFRRVLGSH